MSLEATEKECAAVATAPRVTLADIEAAIANRYDITGDRVATFAQCKSAGEKWAPEPSLRVLSICILVMRNGFTIIGKSAPASPENFNAEVGRKLAYEDAVRQAWPLFGFALRDRLA